MRNILYCALLVGLLSGLTYCHNNGQTKITDADSIAATFHPSWSEQATIYEVNLRQYSSAGNFAGFEKSLPRLKEMGVNILWFMPINPIGMIGRKNKPTDLGSYYSVRDYYAVNPEFGTFEQWKELVRMAHESGFKVILDWVPNHTAPDHPWISKHPDYYKKDNSGKPAVPFDWTDTRQLDYSNREMCDSMVAAMKFWIDQSDIDGFRCDVAWNVPDSFWRAAIGSLRKIKPIFMLAEGEKPGLNEAGFDATYPWSVMNVAYGIYSGKTSVRQLDSIINHNDSIYPKNAFRMYFTTNHDENSWNGTEFERFGDAYKTFAVWAFTMGKSIPLIYSGQEEPNKKRLAFFVRDSIHWNQYALIPFYKNLVDLRKSTPALAGSASFARLKTSADEVIYAYERKAAGRKLVVILNLSAHTTDCKIQDEEIKGAAKEVFTGSTENLDTQKQFNLQPWSWLVYDYTVQ